MHDGYDETSAKEYAINDLLCEIEAALNEKGKTNADYGIPCADIQLQLDLDIEITERDVNAEYFHDTNLPLLNTMQWQIYDTITDCIREDIGNFYFIDAPEGTGKTFLMNIILAFVQKQQLIAIATAASGIASILLTKGTTAHSHF